MTPRARTVPTQFAVIVILMLVVAGFFCARGARAESIEGETANTATASAPATTATTIPPPEDYFGLWTLLPAALAILLAILTRQVMIALSCGIVLAAMMGLPWSAGVEPARWALHPVPGLRAAVETYLVGAVADADHVKIMLFTLMIGGAIGVIGAAGGTSAIVNLIVPWASNRRRGQLVAAFSGVVVFFDDYANAMIVGPTMRPLFDRLRISREKLAYIVDSTAAPIASIALIGTWLGAEVGYIQDGFREWTDATRPAFLNHVAADGTLVGAVTGLEAFYRSLPYRFYPIFALAIVFLVAALRRDLGPMLAAERRAVSGASEGAAGAEPAVAGQTRLWWIAALPIVLLVGVTVAILVSSGLTGAREAGGSLLDRVSAVLAAADPYNSILYGTLACLAAAVLLAVVGARVRLRTATEAMVQGMAHMFTTIIVLVLAWALSASIQELHLAQVATAFLRESRFSPHWLPLAVFIAAALVSFATGTSWGTMGILCPVTVTVAGGLIGHEAGLPQATALGMFYASVGSVLAGAVFGDHCSPISDTTVLSSSASDCELGAHVWTQMPYAVLGAVVGMVCGNVLCGATGLSPWIGLGVGAVVLVGFVRLVGRRVEQVG